MHAYTFFQEIIIKQDFKGTIQVGNISICVLATPEAEMENIHKSDYENFKKILHGKTL